MAQNHLMHEGEENEEDAKGKRPPPSGVQNRTQPPSQTATPKWGLPGKGIGETQPPSEIDQSREKQTSRSAGSLQRENPVDEGELKRRPHTAHLSGREVSLRSHCRSQRCRMRMAPLLQEQEA